MKKTLTLICIVLATTGLSACKSEKERQAEEIRAKELASLKNPSSASRWDPVKDLDKKKAAQEEKK